MPASASVPIRRTRCSRSRHPIFCIALFTANDSLWPPLTTGAPPGRISTLWHRPSQRKCPARRRQRRAPSYVWSRGRGRQVRPRSAIVRRSRVGQHIHVLWNRQSAQPASTSGESREIVTNVTVLGSAADVVCFKGEAVAARSARSEVWVGRQSL